MRTSEDDKIIQNATTKNSDSHNSGDNNRIQIIVDEPAKEDALDFQHYSKNIANIIRGTSPPQFAVGIFGKWGTGKTTLMRMIKHELDRDSEKVLTVWFDAWRYEKEKYLAVIPFLRQIRIALEKDLAKQENGKSPRWKVLIHGLEKTFTAFMVSTEFSVSPEGSPVSTTTNLGKFYDSLKSKGSIFVDGERIQLQEHSTDYLQAALDELKDARIVVFVDDLDRCTPQNALEVIESIKTFFDINGIVYVIGMDSESINHIIKEKYGKDSNVNGIDYLEKIIQLPFQLPDWKPLDISESISKIVKGGLDDPKLIEDFEKGNRKRLIVMAIEPNPRQVKRFINNVILAKSVFGKDIDIDKLIAVRALTFRPEWNQFLDFITNDAIRKQFLTTYIKILNENKTKSVTRKHFLKKYSDLLEIYPNLFDPRDKLRTFLEIGEAGKILLGIDKMERYRRALDPFDIRKFFGKGETMYSSDILDKEYVNPTLGIKMKYPGTWKVNEIGGEILVTFSPPQSVIQNRQIGNFIIRHMKRYDTLGEAVEDIRQERRRVSIQETFHIEEERDVKLANIPAHIIKMRRQDRVGPSLPLLAIMCIITKGRDTYTLGYTQHEKKYFDYLPPIEKMIESFEITK